MSIPPNIAFYGKVVDLKQGSPSDDVAMQEILSDTTTMAHLLGMVPEGGWPLENVVKRRVARAERLAKNEGFSLNIYDKKSGKLAGSCGLNTVDYMNKRADFGIIVHHPFWRTGVATEAMMLIINFAFDELHMHRVTGETSVGNTGMRKSFEKFGFKLEGIDREAIFSRGTFEDEARYAVLENEWKIARPKIEENFNSYLNKPQST
eukprot:Phypoly_transcript_20201.p1 GENE.Phypoly_transcript_20201~~Phypoly_transcript_20201.p1  ORF type:complete len:206 (-),score=27.13 Phypoly_transcript_20201:25-642(-)